MRNPDFHRHMLKSKIHRATVTESNLHYVGSVTIAEDLMEAADLLDGEKVSILDITNGTRLESYVITGERGTGVIGINGAAAHLVHLGDLVIIVSYCTMADSHAASHRPTVIHVGEGNVLLSVGNDPAAPSPNVPGQQLSPSVSRSRR